MLKVFLVEDEFLIRDAIKRTVNWEREGFELVGEAGDGERAYPMIMKSRPDIVITDIRMPFMDGLELSGLIRKQLPKTKILILSGYDDFAYAKEAISLGVAEYLLKPVSGEQLLEALNRIRTIIESEKNKIDYKRIYEEEHKERLKLEKSKFLKMVLNGRYSMTEAIEQGQLLGIDLMAPSYCVMQVQMVPGNDTNGEAAERQLPSISEEMDAYLEALRNVETYEQIGDIFCLLLTGNSEEELRMTKKMILEKLQMLLQNQPNILYFASIGKTVARLSEIHESYHDASRQFSKRFLYSDSCVFDEQRQASAHAEDEVEAESAEKIDLSTFNIRFIDRKILRSFIRNGTAEEIPAFLEEVLENMGKNNLSSRMLRQYLTVDVYLTMAAYLQLNGHTAEETEALLPPPSGVREFESLNTMKDYLSSVLEKVIWLKNEQSESRYSSVIAEAERYLEQHYADKEISLGVVSEHVGVSPNHFSRIYSQERGRTFIEALTEYRMEKARELLLETDETSSEIALEVGYNDPHYFYYTFKKTQNMTPKEFRSGFGQEH